MITDVVAAHARTLPEEDFPAFVYDLGALRSHAKRIRSALSGPGAPEIFYAAKANPDAQILRTLEPFVDGIEVASGGELEHVRAILPSARIAWGGPGKTDAELKRALELDVERIHVESPHELTRLANLARAADREVDVLLRVNLAGDRAGAVLAMSGPFGMDPKLIESCHAILAASPWVRLRGIHAHLASGLDALALLRQAAEILEWARPWADKAGVEAPEFNLGGGMAVDYSDPNRQFDWMAFGQGLQELATPGEKLRIEPGRAVSVYAGWYITQAMDVKQAHDHWYAILRGGTHHFRTPVTKQHNQPFTVLPQKSSTELGITSQPVTLVGQLCTPKDVFARQVPVEQIRVGDVVAFAMAGAYAWNISHHDFLMHPKPTFHYLDIATP
ncbi:type III PLP-dependent enzyme [Streptomyces palmae]|uniref:Type III PLP-dependent enzyme n=1 Tax=Streptomyces palmae TaxID=1701085 RepID=A0A4Z0HDW4_9ACTN|nr:type III PLP-dependent enzyme [Streptomyces palmae]TGB10824.1 type III PLP-dependent enzyme [Streptomyces palmae]